MVVPNGNNTLLSGACTLCRREAKWRTVIQLQDIETKEFFFILECPHCGILKTWPMPQELAPYYEGELGQAMRKSGGPIYSILKRWLLKTEVRRLTSLRKNVTFLDIGCGNGDIARLLHEAGHKVIAIDMENQRPESLKNLPTLPYRTIDDETYEIRNFGKVENGVAILRHLVEHLKDPPRFFQKLASYGVRYFYVALPNAGALERSLLGQYWFLWDPPRHLWHFNARSLEIFLKESDIEILKQGRDISPVIIPSLYRFLRLKNAPQWFCRIFSPKGSLCGIMTALNFLLPRNTLWVLGQRVSGPI